MEVAVKWKFPASRGIGTVPTGAQVSLAVSVDDSWSGGQQVRGAERPSVDRTPGCITAVAETPSSRASQVAFPFLPSGIPVSQKTWPWDCWQTGFACVPLYQQMLPTCGFLLSEKAPPMQLFSSNIARFSFPDLYVCFGLGLFVLACAPNICLYFFMYLWVCMCILVHAQFVG